MNANDPYTSEFHVCLSKLGIRVNWSGWETNNEKGTEPTLQHRSVRGVCDGEYVWRYLVPFDAFILFHDLLGVDGQLFVRVDHHAEQARVCLQKKKTEKWGIRDREKMVSNEQTKKKQIIGRCMGLLGTSGGCALGS